MTPNPETKLPPRKVLATYGKKSVDDLMFRLTDDGIIIHPTDGENGYLSDPIAVISFQELLKWRTSTTLQPPVEVKDLKKVAEHYAGQNVSVEFRLGFVHRDLLYPFLLSALSKFAAPLLLELNKWREEFTSIEQCSGVFSDARKQIVELLRKIEEQQQRIENLLEQLQQEEGKQTKLQSQIAVKDEALQFCLDSKSDFFNATMWKKCKAALTTDGSELGEAKDKGDAPDLITSLKNEIERLTKQHDKREEDSVLIMSILEGEVDYKSVIGQVCPTMQSAITVMSKLSPSLDLLVKAKEELESTSKKLTGWQHLFGKKHCPICKTKETLTLIETFLKENGVTV